ncbi:glycosyltransferase family 2 protein [Kaistella sp.]|uniref:glycosyltransferase family 2 protein n=1 Tax=Kaistella sp. TaxID=2782235 RepID=UPI002F94D699
MTTPKISVLMLTYNHATYLKEAIEGVLMQNTNFPFELIICNDASPDHSDRIIKTYAEKYPEIIRYFRHDKNIGFVENQRFAFQQAKGKYLGYCEGDDYWTDENKLQFQVDFLENNPEYVMTTSRNLLLYQESGKLTEDGKDYMFGNQEFIDYSQESFFRERPTQTFTYLLRRELLDLKWADVYPNYRDLYYFYHLLAFGKGRAFNKVVGVYRLHEGGVYSSLAIEKKLRTSISIFKNIKKQNNDTRANHQIIKDLDQLINKYYYLKEFPLPIFHKNLFKSICERFEISKDYKILFLQLVKTVKYSLQKM